MIADLFTSLGADVPYQRHDAPLRCPTMVTESAPGPTNTLGIHKPGSLNGFAGMVGNASVVVDGSLPLDVIEFRDPDSGDRLGRIFNLGNG